MQAHLFKILHAELERHKHMRPLLSQVVTMEDIEGAVEELTRLCEEELAPAAGASLTEVSRGGCTPGNVTTPGAWYMRYRYVSHGLPSTVVCPQMFALDYCLPSTTTVCPQLTREVQEQPGPA